MFPRRYQLNIRFLETKKKSKFVVKPLVDFVSGIGCQLSF